MSLPTKEDTPTWDMGAVLRPFWLFPPPPAGVLCTPLLCTGSDRGTETFADSVSNWGVRQVKHPLQGGSRRVEILLKSGLLQVEFPFEGSSEWFNYHTSSEPNPS